MPIRNFWKIWMLPSANVCNSMLQKRITSRLATIGTFCVLGFGFLSEAQAFECDVAAQELEPAWVAQIGTNSDLQTVYGYAQTTPQSGKSFTDVLRVLKSNALADLALNIRSNVSSEISTEMNFDGDNASDKTSIKAASQSSLSFGALGGTHNYVGHRACMEFTRVSLKRSDIPYVLALSEFRQFEAALKSTPLTMPQLADLPRLLSGLQTAAKSATPATQQQYGILAPEIEQVSALARDQEIALMAAQIGSLTGSPKQKRDFLQRLSKLLGDKGNDATQADLEIKQAVDETLAALNSVVGSKLTAVSWRAQSAGVNDGLQSYFAKSGDTYWLAGTSDDAAKLLDLSSQYDLSSALFIDITMATARQFGIDEVAIDIQMNFYANGKPQPGRTKTVSGKAIGRPINDTIISQKIISLIQAAL